MINLVNLRDYPREQYTHYWEIQIEEHDVGNDGLDWCARFLPYASPADESIRRRHDELRKVGKAMSDLEAIELGEDRTVQKSEIIKIEAAAQAIWENEIEPSYLEAANAQCMKGKARGRDMEEMMDNARRASQQWILDNIEKYRRA